MPKYILCRLLLLLISACGVPPRATASPTPVVISIALTPSLEPIVETLHTCAANQEHFVLNIDEAPVNSLDFQSADVIIRLGYLPGNNFPIRLGKESIQFIVNVKNPVKSISLSNIQDIYTGNLENWDKVGGMQEPVQVWVYPDGSDVRSIFDSVIIPGEGLSNQARLAPDPQAMLEAIADSTQAIGYIPQSWLTRKTNIDAVKPLDIDKNLAARLQLPILAFSPVELKDPLRGLLACVQSNVR